ncbi:GspH/FimT family protein [Simiduia sp. 21SJ11W-1]|uniref:GspH/FimT family protein n=1 Tax=Simiduia sp. 21SJ11W-1 TaxID=2909669 RepID=UPI00209C817C|nr:GspH/FimT family protein [Simiduia sp. 21SJ11W-1]UTA47331.1 GspH/FimT family protein [Simiduia sp. 21SJ11W-1]
MTRAHGLTLLNLLISLAIISILSFVVIPGFAQILANNQATLTINTAINAIRFARAQAILHGQHVTLCPYSYNVSCGNDWAAGFTAFQDFNKNGKLDGDEEVLRVIELYAAGTVKWSSFGASSYLMFTPLGFTKSQNGTFIYCPKNKDATLAKVLIINRQGRVRQGQDTNNNNIPERSSGQDVVC